MVGFDQEDGQERALLGPAKGKRLVTTRDLHRAEHPELHRGRGHCEPDSRCLKGALRTPARFERFLGRP